MQVEEETRSMNFQRNKVVRFANWSPGRASTRPSVTGVLKTLRNRFKNVAESFKRGEYPQSEDENEIPRDTYLQNWKRVFLFVCVVALAVDPFFFYIPVYDRNRFCLALDKKQVATSCVLRTLIDALYLTHIMFYFRTHSQVSLRGELVVHSKATAKAQCFSYLMIDILSVLPIPQVLVLAITLRTKLPSLVTKEKLKWVIFFQYIPRGIRIYPLYKQVTRASGRVTETKWVGAALNLFLYMLASHVFGAFWYLISIERKDKCWREACANISGCIQANLYCARAGGDNGRFLNASCPLIDPEQITNPEVFNFGMFTEALQSGVVESRDFLRKFFHCFWWGLRNLSALGQNLKTSDFIGDIVFAIIICISGLVLFSLLIGNMQKYLQSTTVRAEEMEEKKRDTEKWMSHRVLPEELRKRIRKYEHYRWRETRGVEEEALLHSLPKDIKRDTKRHLCLDLLKRVPMFNILDDRLLDALCVIVKPVFYSQNSYIVRKDDPVEDMLFVLRGNLISTTNNDGRTGFYNAFILKAGDFCFAELLEWALSLRSSPHFPISSITVQARTNVEGFVLSADDLKFVVTQYSWFHSRQFKRIFRFFSVQWRTWAACYIQAAWRSHLKRKLSEALRAQEGKLQNGLQSGREGTTLKLGAAIYASRFASKALRDIRANAAHCS